MLTKPVLSPVPMAMRFGLQAFALVSLALRVVDHRGLFSLAARLRHIGNQDLVVQMHPYVRMCVASQDAYWLSFLPRDRVYEPEIEALLQRFEGDDALFCDAGANLGYWSIMANLRFGWPVVAIEAAPQTVKKLRQNLALNDCDVTVVERAVSGRDGDTVPFHFEPLDHAGARVAGSPSSLRFPVSTITIDTALAEQAPRDITILKIDVEGQEQAALDGAGHTLAGRCVVVYEEHAALARCEVTERLLAAGYTILFLEDGARFVRIDSAKAAKARLTHAAVGYNFIATRLDSVIQRMLA